MDENVFDWEEEVLKTIDILDKLNLPQPMIREDVKNYMDRVENEFKDSVDLPKEFKGELFYWIDQVSLGEYLANRFNMICSEEIRWMML